MTIHLLVSVPEKAFVALAILAKDWNSFFPKPVIISASVGRVGTSITEPWA